MAQTPAQKTWTQANLYNLANAYAAKNQGTPPPAVPAPPAFNPNADPGYVATTGATGQQLSDLYAGLGVSLGADGTPTYSGGAYLQGAQNYGVDESGNPIAAGDVRYNPFSQLNALKQSFENRKRGTVNSYAANGQFYSGALSNAQTTDATNYAQSNDSLQRNAKGYYSGLVAKALSGRDTGMVNDSLAQGTALNNQLAAHANDPAPVLPANVGAVKGGVKAPPSAKAPKLRSIPSFRNRPNVFGSTFRGRS